MTIDDNEEQYSKHIEVFVVHGRDDAPLSQLRNWVKRRPELKIVLTTLEERLTPGDSLPDMIERVASSGDAAIVLATAEDLAKYAAGGEEQWRMRQNVILETGIFWARLGLKRTAILVRGTMEMPTDLAGVVYIPFENSLSEKEPARKLRDFLMNLRELPPDHLTEVLWASVERDARDRHWREVHEAADHELTITGISMGLIQTRLADIFELLRRRPNLLTSLVVVDPEFVQENEALFSREHRPTAVDDNHRFFVRLAQTAAEFADVADRLRVFLHSGLPSFSAVVADGPGWGSSMVTQVFVPQKVDKPYEHPRLKLKRRTRDGVYMTYWRAIKELKSRSTKAIQGVPALVELSDRVQQLIERRRLDRQMP